MSDASEKRTLPLAQRSPAEPILVPRTDKQHWWESNGVFNPGVTEYKDNILLLYRAYDTFRISRLGLANSRNGVDFTRYDHPAIDTSPNDVYERLGIEDPRITKIGSTYYILHTSASYHKIGDQPDIHGVMDYIPWRIRVGMHSTEDFKHYRHWGVILPHIPAKNACLLPEKINGHYGLYYRETTADDDILKIIFSSNFRDWSTPKIIDWPQPDLWQTGKFGTGSQPISTPEGFLMVYHAVDTQHTYRLGLILFDRQDPSKIIWYSDPVLEPELPYEKIGFVPNVVYCCGALIRNNELWIYYGAADHVIGRATMSLKNIL